MASKLLIKINDTLKGKVPLKLNRSKDWPKVRKAFLEKNNFCNCCGGRNKLEVHHIKPFHLYPELELEESNLITLCEDGSDGLVCHLAIGHLGSYKSYNLKVREDSEYLNNKLLNRPSLKGDKNV